MNSTEYRRLPIKPCKYRLSLPVFITICLLSNIVLYAQSSESGFSYPRIDDLHIRDVQFKQFQSDVEFSYRRLASLEVSSQGFLPLAEDLTIFSYQVKEGDDIFKLAARCNIHYAAISTLNRLGHPSSLLAGSVILLPSVPGIFVPVQPQNDVEQLLVSSRNLQQGISINIRKNGSSLTYLFLPGADFSQTERAFYLNDSFRFPLENYRLTSSFGSRISPITGNTSFHKGLDLAASTGTEVFATRDGTVAERGENAIFGKYIIINHGENWASLYGHLSEILIPLQSTVQSGTLIGKVGSTGLSTGPHLHFELRQNGQAQDPGRYFLIEGNP
ncbi:MAG: M23 family metallopeptidase [Treponema sp.]|jgi:murein DD-endopeptidase MepM/ murein hydrolase activator NlpD|nr:M23 family metallopeptidase [Treponema sp.]